MCSSSTWSFIKDSKLTKTKPESCIRNAHLLEKTTTTRTTERKNLRNLFFKWKKGKRKFLHANYLKYRDNFNITTTGVGLLPTATTIRIMNGPHAFALSAFKSEQKSAKKKKWTIVWIHVITWLMITYCNIKSYRRFPGRYRCVIFREMFRVVLI